MSAPSSPSSPSPSSPLSSASLSAHDLMGRALRHVTGWEASYGEVASHPSMHVDPETLDDVFSRYLTRLEGNYPFHHPRYAGQMLKPPHPVAMAAYVAAMRINPNNHALDGGPPTSQMEKEVIAKLIGLFDFPNDSLGHLTSGGTIANLEALWVARELHPDRGIAYSADAHYTHGRMSAVLGMDAVEVATDPQGRMRLDALADVLATGTVGTVVLTPGTTGLGVVDRIEDALPICREHGVRIHVDAAYGGFFRLLAHADAPGLDGFPAASFAAIADCDSVAVDPHKHGLQPYGCGSILFRDPTVGRFYKHDSPYTYFTSDDLHLGEITLECSRAGASAGALWCTLEALPLKPDAGIGRIVAATHRAARIWADHVDASDGLTLLTRPETDIVAYFPADVQTLSEVDAASRRLFEEAMHRDEDALFTSLYRLPAKTWAALQPDLEIDAEHGMVLRSVLMKPEHETYAADLVDDLSKWALNLAE